MPDGQYYNVYMIGRRIGMPPPLSDGAVTYDDGAPQTVDQYAKDVTSFLMWVAEPHLEARKHIGQGVVAFLIVFAVTGIRGRERAAGVDEHSGPRATISA